jgi:hypothetical protein
MTLLFGLVALAILLWAAQKYLKADPRKLAAVLKLSGGIAMLVFAAIFAFRGQLAIAAPLAAAGLGLLGWLPFGPPVSARVRRKARGRFPVCARPFLKWSSITTAARCAA